MIPNWIIEARLLKDVIIGSLAPIITLVVALFAWWQTSRNLKKTLQYEFYSKNMEHLTKAIKGVIITRVAKADENYQDSLQKIKNTYYQQDPSLERIKYIFSEEQKLQESMLSHYYLVRHLLNKKSVNYLEEIIDDMRRNVQSTGSQSLINNRDALIECVSILRCFTFSFYNFVLQELDTIGKKFK